MNKKIIIWIFEFIFLIVLTEHAYAAADVIGDSNITGSKLQIRKGYRLFIRRLLI